MKVLSLFSGIGAFEKALKNLNIDYELVNYCEIDKYASKSYSLIHNVSEDKNLGDITKVDENKLPKDIDLITHGSPCTSISLVGLQKGANEGSGTPSSLMWETMRIVKSTSPKYIIWENVKNVLSKRHKQNFDKYIYILQQLGYNNYYKVLNAKDFGIPQNRERIYCVSIRKDIDNKKFEFPKPFELKIKLKDLLEETVDEKYFVSEKLFNCISGISRKNKDSSFDRTSMFLKNLKKVNGGIARTITIKPTTRPEGNYILVKEATKKEYKETYIGDGVYIDRPHQKREVVQKEMIPTLKCNGNDLGVVVEKGETKARLITKEGNIKKYIDSAIIDMFEEGDCSDISFPNGYKKENRVFKEHLPALNTTTTKKQFIFIIKVGSELRTIKLRIRKLTPKECFRLMGFEDKDVDLLIENKISNSQLYKQAGNSIVVNVLVEIFKNLFIENKKIN